MSKVNVKSVIEQLDLVEYAEKYTTLNKSGSQYRGVCPICKHGDETEFVVYNHKTFFCFVCHVGGDVINLLRAVRHLDYYAAVDQLAEELNIDIVKDAEYVKRKTLSMKYKEVTEDCKRRVNVVRDYLMEKRGLTEETIKEFELGSNDHGDVVIPYIDENDRHVGLAIRRFEGSPKYKNSKNNELFTKAAFLYNLRGAKQKKQKELYLVEGYFCAMTLHQEGYAAVAYNSSQLSKQQCEVLQKMHKMNPEMTAIIVPDKDGVAYPLLEKTRRNIINAAPDVPFQVVELPDGVKDVNEMYMSVGQEEFDEKFLALPTYDLDGCVLDIKLGRCTTQAAEKKVVEAFIKEVSDPITLDDIAEALSSRWKLEKRVVREFLKVSQNAVSLREDFKNPEQCYEETRLMLTDERLQYGITALDEGLRGGGRRKDVTFIGAAAGVGKTFLTVQMCMDMVVRQRKNAIYFSMEMAAGALYERVISNLLGESAEKVEEMIKENDPLVEKLLEKLKEHLYVVDKNGLTIGDIDKYVKEANAKIFEGTLDVIFIDYIQYMKGCSEYQVLAETAKGMKPLAKDNNIHVVVISQLNRGSKAGTRPELGNLKGGGDLEASADNVFLMWKPTMSTNEAESEFLQNQVNMYIAKARNGSTADEMELMIDPATSRMRVK